eukprot:TRINITY_DN2031_c1_g1_i10.p3 TRINITY_DN2031_c1_g1~~TRINITY_DN2031_c1_g1_i10.p3  ORF type:complete len:244 (-),score=-29.94 TRINITY_DN2031_c1_g1_i10:250-981(-)
MYIHIHTYIYKILVILDSYLLQIFSTCSQCNKVNCIKSQKKNKQYQKFQQLELFLVQITGIGRAIFGKLIILQKSIHTKKFNRTIYIYNKFNQYIYNTIYIIYIQKNVNFIHLKTHEFLKVQGKRQHCKKKFHHFFQEYFPSIPLKIQFFFQSPGKNTHNFGIVPAYPKNQYQQQSPIFIPIEFTQAKQLNIKLYIYLQNFLPTQQNKDCILRKNIVKTKVCEQQYELNRGRNQWVCVMNHGS